MTAQVVTPAQVLAAQLLVELRREDGEEPDGALLAIAEAKPVGDDAPSGARDDRRRLEVTAGELLQILLASPQAWEDNVAAVTLLRNAQAHGEKPVFVFMDGKLSPVRPLSEAERKLGSREDWTTIAERSG